MLQVTIPESEFFDERTSSFIQFNETTLTMEHSLISLSKWEMKWQKSFLSLLEKQQLTHEQTIDYIRCMIITPALDRIPFVDVMITPDVISKVQAYINNPMTATVIGKNPYQKPGRKKVITSELIYAWMISYGVPLDMQKWHLNRLLTLLRVLQVENGGSKKMANKDIYAQNRALNEARRTQFHSKG